MERAPFDDLLLRHAQACGAEVRAGLTVGKFTHEGDSITVQARDEQGNTETLRGVFLIDASGRGNLTGNQEKLRIVHPDLKKLAVFGHFAGVALDAGERAGDTVIVRLEDKWFWLIPLSKEKVSVGCVMDQAEFAALKEPPAAIFTRLWQASPALRARMENARLLGPMHTTGDFSYRNRRFTGPRLLRVGDAAEFMDPIFSAGVFLACHSGKLAGELVTASLHDGDDGARRMKRYEKQVHHAMALYWEMVEGFYTSPFMELFMSPRAKFSLPSAITAVLAGELEGGWAMRWRMRVFFWLVKLQRIIPLVPRLTFKDTPPDGRPAETTELLMVEKR